MTNIQNKFPFPKSESRFTWKQRIYFVLNNNSFATIFRNNLKPSTKRYQRYYSEWIFAIDFALNASTECSISWWFFQSIAIDTFTFVFPLSPIWNTIFFAYKKKSQSTNESITFTISSRKKLFIFRENIIALELFFLQQPKNDWTASIEIM